MVTFTETKEIDFHAFLCFSTGTENRSSTYINAVHCCVQQDVNTQLFYTSKNIELVSLQLSDCVLRGQECQWKRTIKRGLGQLNVACIVSWDHSNSN